MRDFLPYKVKKHIEELTARGFVTVNENGVYTPVEGKRVAVRASPGKSSIPRRGGPRGPYKRRVEQEEAHASGLQVTSMKIPASQLVAALPDSILIAEAQRRGFSTSRNSIFEMVDWES